MADPAGRLIAATTNANSALFICASQVCSGRLFARFADVRLIQNFTRARKPLDVRGRLSGPEHPRYFELVLECDPQTGSHYDSHQRSTRIIGTPDESTDMFGKKHDEALFGALHHMQNDFAREGTDLNPVEIIDLTIGPVIQCLFISLQDAHRGIGSAQGEYRNGPSRTEKCFEAFRRNSCPQRGFTVT